MSHKPEPRAKKQPARVSKQVRDKQLIGQRLSDVLLGLLYGKGVEAAQTAVATGWTPTTCGGEHDRLYGTVDVWAASSLQMALCCRSRRDSPLRVDRQRPRAAAGWSASGVRRQRERTPHARAVARAVARQHVAVQGFRGLR